MTTQTVNMEIYQLKNDIQSAGNSTNPKATGKMSAILSMLSASAAAVLMVLNSSGSVQAQEAQSVPMVQSASFTQHSTNIFNYTTVYNSGKVFVNWTAKDEPADCIYIVERSADGRKFESVGVKEGIGTSLELFYSWMDHTPPAGFAYYRVKKITKDGSQIYSATNTIINQGSSFDQKSNYAKGDNEIKDLK